MSGPAGMAAEGTLWVRSPEALWRRLPEGVAVLPRDGSAVCTLDGVHAEVWGALARPADLDAMVDQLGERLGEGRRARRSAAAESVHFLVAVGAVRESPQSAECAEGPESRQGPASPPGPRSRPGPEDRE
jgi:hypothetical protein